MKKILSIIVLGLLLSGNANTEIINLSCITKEVLIGIKKDRISSSIGKTNIERIDTQDKNRIITESSYYYLYTPVVEENIINGKKFSRGISLEKINRFTGEYTLTSIEGTNEDAEIFRVNFNKAKNNDKILFNLKMDISSKYMNQAEDKRIFNSKIKKSCKKAEQKF